VVQIERPGKFYLEFLQGVQSFKPLDAKVCIMYSFLGGLTVQLHAVPSEI
jgi:hypothetical protein